MLQQMPSASFLRDLYGRPRRGESLLLPYGRRNRSMPSLNMKTKSFLTPVGIGMTLVLCAPQVFAQSESEGGTSIESTADIPSSTEVTQQANNYFGGQLGAGVLGSSGGAHLNFGLQLGRKILPSISTHFIAGLFFDHISRGSINSQDDPSGGLNLDSNLNFYGVEGDYLLSQLVPGAQVGLKLALGNNNVSVNGVSSSSTDLYLGPKVAYDVGIGGGLTGGLEGNILFGTGTDSRTTTSILGTLKYWLG